jgi:hypothetical protein
MPKRLISEDTIRLMYWTAEEGLSRQETKENDERPCFRRFQVTSSAVWGCLGQQ